MTYICPSHSVIVALGRRFRCSGVAFGLAGILLTFNPRFVYSLDRQGQGGSPAISGVQVFRYGGFVWVIGKALDRDGGMSGRPVYIWGAVGGITPVRADGAFQLVLYGSNTRGTVYARTVDAQGNLSNIAVSEYFE